MNKFKIYILSLKRNFIAIIFLLFIVFLVLFSKSNLTATKNGLLLWANSVIPSLLPFFIGVELLTYTNIVSIFEKLLNKFMRPIFNVPGCGAFAFILGLISGYPVGAKIVTDLRNNGFCTKREGERMLCFTNNSGPLFILGTVGSSMFGNSEIGLLLLITHILSCITVGILLGLKDRFFLKEKISKNYFKLHNKFNEKNKKMSLNSYNKSNEKRKNTLLKSYNNSNENSKKVSLNSYSRSNEKSQSCHLSNLGDILGKSISTAINSVVMIGGFIVLFSVILSILDKCNILTFASNILSNFTGLDECISKGFISRLNRTNQRFKIM